MSQSQMPWENGLHLIGLLLSITKFALWECQHVELVARILLISARWDCGSLMYSWYAWLFQCPSALIISNGTPPTVAIIAVASYSWKLWQVYFSCVNPAAVNLMTADTSCWCVAGYPQSEKANLCLALYRLWLLPLGTERYLSCMLLNTVISWQ